MRSDNSLSLLIYPPFQKYSTAPMVATSEATFSAGTPFALPNQRFLYSENDFLRAFMKKNNLFLLLLAVSVLHFASVQQIFAHGDEDHGDQKPKVATNEKGTITRTARLGEYELTLKHQFLVPNMATSAKLFVTKFQTNEPIEKGNAVIEIESASGSVTEAAIEKTETAGSYNVKIPALQQGTYTIRIKLTYGGETDTATFSSVEVTPALNAAESTLSWARTTLIAFVFLLVVALLGGLIYLVWHFADGKPTREETVSA